MAKRNVRTISTHSLIERENKKVRGYFTALLFLERLINLAMARY